MLSPAGGAGPVSLTSIFKDLDKISNSFTIETIGFLGRFSDTMGKTHSALQEAEGAMKSVLAGDFKKAGIALTKLTKDLDGSLIKGLTGIVAVGTGLVGVAADTLTFLNDKMAQARGGAMDTMHALVDDSLKFMSGMPGVVGKLGQALTSIINNAISSVQDLYADYMARQMTRQAAEAQLGTGQRAEVMKDMGKYMNQMGRAEAEAWTKGMIQTVGAANDRRALDVTIQTGKTMGYSAEEMMAQTNQIMASTISASDAADKLQQNYRAMQKAAEVTKSIMIGKTDMPTSEPRKPSTP